MRSHLLSFALFDAVNRDVKRGDVQLGAPKLSDIPAGTTLMYACDLKLGPEYVPTREVVGLSPIECLATALAIIDSWIRFEHHRAPLVWDDGRAYGGDYDIPIVQVIEQYNAEAKAAFAAASSRSGAKLQWPDT